MPENRNTPQYGRNSSQKLIPRDISESLGKLPPQSLDMEEAVLGAVLIEKNAITEIIGFLKPEHFYKESHKEVYSAIVSLHVSGTPVDMRSVVAELRRMGKLEMVGGPVVIPQLTAGVSRADNIRHHATIVIQMSLKRQMIELASKIHHEAYEDTTDPLELLRGLQSQLENLDKNTFNQSGPERIKALWKETLLTEEPPEQNVLIRINGKIVASSGNHSLIVGKKKSRKTLFIIQLIFEYLQNDSNAKPEDIALFDTEQGKSHVWKIRQKIFDLTGHWVPIFYLRGMGPADRRSFISETVKHWNHKLKLIVCDGIRDCMSNINDPDETTEVIMWLEKLTLENDLHVINVLHLNKTDGNPRGHIGSELQNKAQITIEMEKDDKTGHTIVKCESSREEEFDPFAFTHGPSGLPMMVDMPVQGQHIPEPDRRNRLHIVFEDGPMKYTELIEGIKEQFGCGPTKAKTLLAEFRRNGWVVKIGDKTNATYRLMAAAATADFGTFTKEVKGVNEQPEVPAPTEPPPNFRPLKEVKKEYPELFPEPPVITPPPPPLIDFDDEPDWVKG